jgi:hypothetical protein
VTDARVGRVAEKVLAEPSPDARVGRVAEKVLAEPSPDIQVGRIGLKVLLSPIPAGTTDYWWDPNTATFQPLDPTEYWWDLSALHPVDGTQGGVWNGGATFDPLS